MMNVDLLAQFIEAALRQKGVVMVPYVGTFAIATEPARITSNGYVILPPSVKVDFQETFSESTDICLAQMLSEEKNIQLSTAITRIDAFCKEFKKVLIENKCVMLPGLGKVRATKENDLFFVPENDLEIGGTFFCLEPIHLKVSEPEAAVVKVPEVVEEKEPATVNVPEETKEAGSEQKKNVGKAGVILIILTITIIVAIATFIIMSRLYPGSTDFLLYNSEEIQLLEYLKEVV